MPPNIYAYNSPYYIAANAYYNSNVRKPGPYDINPFTGQPFTQPRQFSPLEITAMQRFNIDPASLATPEGQQDFATAVALVQQQAIKDAATQYAPVIPDATPTSSQGGLIHNPDPAAHMVDPNMPFVNFVASNPRGRSNVVVDQTTGAVAPYQMTDADKQVLAAALSVLPSNAAKTTYSNLAAANGYTGKGTFQDYVNNLNKTNASLYAAGGILAKDPLAF